MTEVSENSTTTTFRAMSESTQEDWDIIAKQLGPHKRQLADRVLDHLQLLRGEDTGGFAVDRLEHSLQTATRAYRANKDDEYVVCALLHDIGDLLGAYNHPLIATAILEPFVRDDYLWMVKHHGIFQGYYFWHFLGADRDRRDEYRDNPNYDLTVEFCHEFDQAAFDSTYVSMSVSDFEPALRELFSRPRNPMYRSEKLQIG